MRERAELRDGRVYSAMHTQLSPVTVRLLLFAQFREELGGKQRTMALAPGTTPRQALTQLAAGNARLQSLSGIVRFIVNGAFVTGDEPLSDGDELAFVPPVAGGDGGTVLVTGQPLSLDAMLAAVSHPGAGGVVLFLGVVRDNNSGRDVHFLEYEAYDSAAEASMRKIAHDAEARWPGTRVACAHRTGRLEIGEASVVVAASAPHRGEAFEAARFVIDTLKAETPIWKKEVFEGGEVWIGEGA